MNFKNIEKKMKNAILLKMRKESTISKNFNSLVFFKSSRPVCNGINFTFLKKNYAQIHWSFAFLTQNFGVIENCSKTTLNFCPLKCTYLGKISFQFY